MPTTSFTFYKVVIPKRFQRAAHRGSLRVNFYGKLGDSPDCALLQAKKNTYLKN